MQSKSAANGKAKREVEEDENDEDDDEEGEEGEASQGHEDEARPLPPGED